MKNKIVKCMGCRGVFSENKLADSKCPSCTSGALEVSFLQEDSITGKLEVIKPLD